MDDLRAADPSASALPHPGVKVPPPFLFVGGFVGGLLIHRVVPLAGPMGGGVLRVAVAWGLVALGLGLAYWGIGTFRRAQTAIFPHYPAALIVQHGPYRYSRNPMYVGLTVAYVGLALWVNSLWPLLLLPGVLALLIVLVIRREERYLESAFGDEYRRYKQRVRRWG